MLAVDPLHEEATHLLVVANALGGRRVQALRIATQAETRLQQELGVGLAERTRHFCAELRQAGDD